MLKIYKQIISAVFVLMALVSCTPEIEDVFEDSALARLEAYTDSCRMALVDAPYGWIVNYYPNSSSYGGYTFIMDFTEDGYVMMQAEEALNFSGDTSTYRVHSGQSAVLSFDTYSEFHYFSDAEANYIYDDKVYYIDKGVGYGGDFELLCKKIEDDVIYFQGLKGGSKTEFIKISSQEEKDSYLQQQVIIHDNLEAQAGEGYFLVNGNDSLEMTYNNYHYFFAHYLDQVNEYSTSPIPFIINDAGLSFYDTIRFNGAEVKDFVWNTATNRFETESGVYLSAGGTIRGDFTSPATAKVYDINLEKSSSKFLASVDQLSSEMKDKVAESQYFAGIKDIIVVMNGYPTAQELYNGSHSIHVFTEYALEELENMFIFGTTATSMYNTKFNYAISFGDGNGGTQGYTVFHSLVVDWFTEQFATNNDYSVEEQITWSYGEQIVSYKLSRVNDPDYYIVFRPRS